MKRSNGLDQKKSKGKRDIKRRYWIIPLTLSLLLFGYYLLSSVFFPVLLRKNLPLQFHQKTGLHLKIDSAKFNPLFFSFHLGGIEIDSTTDKGVARDLLSINELYLDLDFTSLLRNVIASEKLTINNATLNIFRYKDKRYNISQLFPTNSDKSQETLSFAELPFLYSLNNISINDSTIIFNDQETNKVHTIKELNLRLPTLSNFSFDAGNYIQPQFSAIINGSPIELINDSKDTPTPTGSSDKTKLTCSLRSIDLPLYANYFPLEVPFKIKSGKADGTLQISFSSKNREGRHLLLSYNIFANDVILESHDEALALSSRSVNLEGSIKPLENDFYVRKLFLKEPNLNIKKSITPSTVNSLFLDGSLKKPVSGLTSKSLSLTVESLIADNGKIVFESEEENLVFQHVQASIKNFTNDRTLRTKKRLGEDSFRISGESANDFSLLSWQGSFLNTTPIGKLKINNLPTSQALKFIAPESKINTGGKVNINGDLTLKRSLIRPLTYEFNQGIISYSDLTAKENKEEWLSSSDGKIAPVSIKNGVINLGNIFLNESNFLFSKERISELLSAFDKDQGLHLKGVELIGKIKLQPTVKAKSPYIFDNVHLQIAQLDRSDSKEENFAFTSAPSSSTSIKAKGKISISPLKGNIKIALKNIPADLVTPLLPLDNSFVPDKNTSISSAGVFNLDTKAFNGTMEISNGHYVQSETNTTFGFEKGAFGKVSIGPGNKAFDSSNALFKKVLFSSNDLRFQAEGMTMSYFNKKGDDIKIGGTELSETTISVKDSAPKAIEPLFKDKKKSFSLESLLMSGKVDLIEENNVTTPFFDNFELQVSNLDTNHSTSESLSFKGNLGEQGMVAGEGTISIFPINTRLNFQFSGIDMSVLNRFSNKLAQLNLSATSHGKLTYQYPKDIYSGKIILNEGGLNVKESDFQLSWNNAILSDVKITNSPYSFNVGKMVLDMPKATLKNKEDNFIPTLRNSLQKIVSETGGTSETTTLSMVDITKMIIRDGEINYIDERIIPSLPLNISSLNGNINNFQTLQSPLPTDFNFEGAIAGSKFSYGGKYITADNDQKAEEIFSLQLKNFPLTYMQSQLSTLFDIDESEAFFDLHYKREDVNQPAYANVEFTSLKSDQESPITALTLALLQDKNKTINESLAIPNPDKPLFLHLKNHYQKLLIKSGVSPYLLLKPPHDKLIESKSISFAPGGILLDKEMKEKLSGFAKLLKEHPQVKIIFKASIDQSIDAPPLKKKFESINAERIKEKNKRIMQQWKNSKNNTLPPSPQKESISVENITVEELKAFTPASIQPVVVTESMLSQLGEKRLEQISHYLIQEHSTSLQNLGFADKIHIVDNTGSSEVTISLSHIDLQE